MEPGAAVRLADRLRGWPGGGDGDDALLIAGQFAIRLGLGQEVRDGLQQVFERWDGRGAPAKLSGEQIRLAVRIAVLADIFELFRRLGGLDAAVEVVRDRAGGQFDPALAEHVCANADTLVGGTDEAPGWQAVIAAEPSTTSDSTAPATRARSPAAPSRRRRGSWPRPTPIRP